MANESAVTINIRGDASGFAKAGRQATGTMNRMKGSAQGSSTGMAGIGVAAGKLGSKLAVVAAGFVGITAAVRATSFAFQTIGGFEQSMAKVQAVTQATDEQFSALSAEARRMGASTVFSASEAAEALAFLGMAGFSAEAAIGSLEDTLNLAVAAGMELGRTADIMSNVMTGFGLSTSEASRAADVLAQAASSSNTDVEQLGQAMKFLAPFASALGVSLEESAAAVGVLGNSGIQAGLAGRGLASVMGQMLNASDFTVNALEAVGLTASDINPEVVGLEQALRNLQNFDVGILAKMFGAENADIVMSLLNNLNGPNGLDGLTTKMQESEGRAKEMSDTMADTLPGAVENLKSAIKELILGTGDAGLGDFFKRVVRSTTESVRNINLALVTIRNAFASGDIGEIFSLSLQMAGINFLNLLGRIGQFLSGLVLKALIAPVGFLGGGLMTSVQMFKTGMLAAAQATVVLLTKGILKMISAANKIPGVNLDKVESNLEAMNKAAVKNLNETVDNLKNPLDQFGENFNIITGGLDDAANSLLAGEAFEKIDTSGLADQMDEVIARNIPEQVEKATVEGQEAAADTGGFEPTLTSDALAQMEAEKKAQEEAEKAAEAAAKKKAEEEKRAREKAAREAEKAAKEQAAREKRLRESTKVDAFRSVGGGGRAFNVGSFLGLGATGPGVTSLRSAPNSPIAAAARVGGTSEITVLNSILVELKKITQNTSNFSGGGGGGLEVEIV